MLTTPTPSAALVSPTPTPTPTSPTDGGPTSPTDTGPTATPSATASGLLTASPATSSPEPTPIPLTTPTPATGAIWQALPDFPHSDAFDVTSVTAAPNGFVAVGFKAMPGEAFFGLRQGVIWRSTDGRTWEADPNPAFEFVTPEDVATIGDSLFVFGSKETCDPALTVECVEPPDAGWGIWRSVLGGPWERLPPPESMRSGTMDGVVDAGGALVGFGWTGDESQSAIVWRSVDGVAWTETTDLAGMDPITAIAGMPTGLIAFGVRSSDDIGDLELVAAASTDGAQFAPVGAPRLAATTIQSIAVGPGGIVAVGDGDDLDAGFRAVALHSADGLTWTEAQAADGSFVGGTMHSVHALPQGFVALGVVPQQLDGTAIGASWLSSDGLNWRTLGQFGGLFSVIDSSTVGSTGVVAFTVTSQDVGEGESASTVAAWFAPLEAFATL